MTMVAALVLLLLSSPRHAATAVVSPFTYADGRITGRLERSDAREALSEIARNAGLEVRGALLDTPPVTVELTDVPVADAVTRVLAGQSFVLTYKAGRLHGVRLLNATGTAFELAPTAPPPAEPDATPVPDDGGERITEASQREVAIGGRLARAVGTDRTSFSEIMAVAMRGTSPRVRADAMRVGLRILDDEPELRASVLGLMNQMPDERLADWLVRMAGPYAVDVVRSAARSTRLEAVRQRARSVEPAVQARLAAAPAGAVPARR